jgi:hypothetical protein
MALNPYAPPAAPVSEVQAQRPSHEPPVAVTRACTVLWCSFGLSTLGVALMRIVSFQLATFVGGLFGVFIGVLLTLWFTVKLKRGRNWMRVLLTIFTVLGILLLPFTWVFTRQVYMASYAGHPVLLTIGITITSAQYVLNLIAVVFLNTRAARAWFRMLKDGGQSAA